MGGEATRFQKGRSGNPSGRPKKAPLTDELKRQLKQKALQDSKRTNLWMIANEMIQRASVGDVAAARLIWEYVEGKPTQRVEFNIAEEAERLAREHGLNAAEIIRTAELIAMGQG